MPRYWQWSYNPAPKAKAGSYRRKYGTSWWGKAFLDALNRMDYSGRLVRGKTYANKGLVEALEKHPNGEITAEVQGSRPTPYRVQINWSPFKKREQKLIKDILTNDFSLLSRLLAGELPSNLAQLLKGDQIALFPENWDNLNVHCSCPDWATPCKHEAAVFYILAAEIDADPFNIFKLRGLDLRAALPSIFGKEKHDDQSDIQPLEDLVRPIQMELPDFGWNDDHYRAIDFSEIEPISDRLLQLLPSNPPFDSVNDFKSFLKTLYKKSATFGRKLLKATVTPNYNARLLQSVAQADLILASDLSVARLSLYDQDDELVLELDSEPIILHFLQQLEQTEELILCDDLNSLRLAYQFVRQIIINGAFIPQILKRSQADDYIVRYLPANNEATIARQSNLVMALLSPGIPFYESQEDLLEWHPTAAGNVVLSAILGIMISQAIGAVQSEHPARRLFGLAGAEAFDLLGTEVYPAAIQSWLNRLHIGQQRYQPVFLIEEKTKNITVDVKIKDLTKQHSLPVPLPQILKGKSLNNDKVQLLKSLGQLAEHFPQLEDHLAGASFPMNFSLYEFTPILKQILPLMEAFGLEVVLPRPLKKLLRPQLGLKAKSSSPSSLNEGIVSLQNIINFDWQTAIGDQAIDPQEFKDLLKQSSGLVRFKEQFAFIEADEVAKLLEKLESPPQLSAAERMQAIFAEQYDNSPVYLDDELKQKIDEWRNGPPVATPKDLQAQLRPYQERGYQWLYANSRFGFGSIIADDMGLGKTLQVISLILKLKEDGALEGQAALVIVPTSLLGNWRNEIDKFAPSLRHATYHGSDRKMPKATTFDVLLTTYGIARIEQKKLNKHPWKIAIIDESQAIKNPTAAQTKAIKRINAPLKVAMSGTPVENRLLDYWSVMDFTLPGYLGNRSQFSKVYGNPIQKELNQQLAQQFKQVTAPFMLRRLKSDKSIINDLPDKVIQDEQCSLMPSQAALYQSVVEENLRIVNESEEGIGRQGLILKLLTALKQVCNHPKHFLKQDAPSFAASGKAELLRERLTSILDNKDKVLIFTQYREMGDLLVKMIEDEFGISVPFLHGGCSSKQREKMVERFQTDQNTPIFILSIKAGGTGLNLTAANHVIHYDLWWNPAVENQATDRAYRIGQQKTVFVHRLITKNTFEEKIDQLIKNKTKLANLTVGTGETWVGKLSNNELGQLVRLSE